MVDRDTGVRGNRRRIAITRLTAWRMRVDQGNLVACALKMQRTTTANHAGPDNKRLRCIHFAMTALESQRFRSAYYCLKYCRNSTVAIDLAARRQKALPAFHPRKSGVSGGQTMVHAVHKEELK